MFSIILLSTYFNFQAKNIPQINPIDGYTYSDTIVWNPTYKLKWDDFKSNTFDSSVYSYLDSTKYIAGAYSKIDITLILKAEKNKLFVDSYAIFIKSQSWSGDDSPKTLLHEQGHLIWENSMQENSNLKC